MYTHSMLFQFHLESSSHSTSYILRNTIESISLPQTFLVSGSDFGVTFLTTGTTGFSSLEPFSSTHSQTFSVTVSLGRVIEERENVQRFYF